jgi:hypothetical protein
VHCRIYSKMIKFNLGNMSINDMDAMQDELITELDDIREVDPETGHLRQTEPFAAVEQKLLLLLEALDNATQRDHLENLAGNSCKDNTTRIKASLRSLSFLKTAFRKAVTKHSEIECHL